MYTLCSRCTNGVQNFLKRKAAEISQLNNKEYEKDSTKSSNIDRNLLKGKNQSQGGSGKLLTNLKKCLPIKKVQGKQIEENEISPAATNSSSLKSEEQAQEEPNRNVTLGNEDEIQLSLNSIWKDFSPLVIKL